MYGDSAVKVKVSLGVRLKLRLNTLKNFWHTVCSAGCPEIVDHFFFIFQKTLLKQKALLNIALLSIQIIMILSIFLSKFLGCSVTTFEILIRIVEDILVWIFGPPCIYHFLYHHPTSHSQPRIHRIKPYPERVGGRINPKPLQSKLSMQSFALLNENRSCFVIRKEKNWLCQYTCI